MKIQFSKQSTEEVIASLKKEMTGRSLSDIVSMESDSGKLIIKISKLGTSTLTFDREERDSNIVFSLSSEKIAFAHKAFKDEVKEKLSGIIGKAGGKILQA
ncbi:MAG: hypothetical protein NT027_05805 [Proteobacteria bacterium]|nr:hypothetical protein [Pseudomonadota bacterium]